MILCNPAAVIAQEPLSITSAAEGDDITLATGKISEYKLFQLPDPPRLVMDLPLSHPPLLSLPANYSGGLIANIRAGQFDTETVRIVFDLQQPVRILSHESRGGALHVQIAGTSAAPSLPSPSKKTAKTKPSSQKKMPPEKPLIIIDAGHGGDDPGAIGPRGTQEKDIVLAFAKALENSLVNSGNYRVLLTRETDRFIPLRERVKIGRASKGTLFISLHADSAPNDEARGLSVYTLSEKASDAETEALAARENKVDVLGGMDLSHEREDVADILISLAQRETRNQSAMFADLLVASLRQQDVNILQNPHRFAGFAVLKAPDIPSVLIETGFISHPQEEKLLKTQNYRKQLVTGITKAIDRYFSKQKPTLIP